MLSETLVTTVVMSVLALLSASRTGVFRAGLAVVAGEPLSPRADRTIVRPSPMTDFTGPVAALSRSVVVAGSRAIVRWGATRSSWVTADGFGAPIRAAALVMPSPTASTRSPAAVAG